MKNLLNFAYSVMLLGILVIVVILPITIASLWRWEKPQAKIIDKLADSVNLITRVSGDKNQL